MATKQLVSSSRLPRVLPYLLIVCGGIAVLCAFIIMLDKLNLLTNPSFRPNCDLNPVLSCGSVMASKQGSAFGFPNPIIGLIGFPIVITTGMMLLAGAKLKRWFWLGLNIGLLLAVAFCLWLFSQSVYVIHALCIYCMIVWITTITSFWYVTLYNLEVGHIKLASRYNSLQAFLRKHHIDILLGVFVIIAILIFQHFWYFYGKYL
jgi:uncharacterized membrane protein